MQGRSYWAHVIRRLTGWILVTLSMPVSVNRYIYVSVWVLLESVVERLVIKGDCIRRALTKRRLTVAGGRMPWLGRFCLMYLAVFPDNLTPLTAFISALTIVRNHSRLQQRLMRQQRLSRAFVLLSRSSIIHGIDFCCVGCYIVFTFPRIIQQGKQIVLFGSKVNINHVRDSICCLSLMESNLSLACAYQGL